MIMTGFLATVLSQSSTPCADLQASLSDLAGAWTGALEYVDGRHGGRVSIPHTREVYVPPNRAYLAARLEFTDPGRIVYRAELMAFACEVVTSTGASEYGASAQNYRVSRFELAPLGWRAFLDEVADSSADQPTGRLTISYFADTLSISRFRLDEESGEIAFSNGVNLRRSDDETGELPD
ncbi:MAG: hypothetical protein GYB36_05880 [Alphaproteobacteria bacterium]|nr:hypothetical protein [Alphaproteobacteria bacterium]